MKLLKTLSNYQNLSSDAFFCLLRVCDSIILHDAFRSMHVFSKILMDFIKKAKSELDLAGTVHSIFWSYGKKKIKKHCHMLVCGCLDLEGLGENEMFVLNGRGS